MRADLLRKVGDRFGKGGFFFFWHLGNVGFGVSFKVWEAGGVEAKCGPTSQQRIHKREGWRLLLGASLVLFDMTAV